MKRVFFALFFIAFLLGGCVQVPLESQSTSSDIIEYIYGSKTIGQSFICQERNLNRIDVKLSIKDSKKPSEVIFKLKDSLAADRNLAEVRIGGSKIQNEVFNTFTFAPIPDSKNKEYYFLLESPNSTLKNPVGIFLSSKDVYPKGAAYLNGDALSGKDLAFQTYIDMDLRQLVNAAMGRILRDKPFSLFYVLLCLIVLACLVWVVVRERDLKRKSPQ
ncbi:MAG: hypothetical protein QME54_00685 [Actinomycetota bacterium]|nr:hypothetical protein [Actinomycetota bacterium]